MSIFSWILTLSIVAGQLIRLPFGPGSMNLLDLFIIGFLVFHLLKFRFKLKKPPVCIKGAMFFVLIAILSLIFSPLKLTLPQILISFSYTLRFLFYIVFAWIISPNFHTLKLAGVSLAILGLLQLIFFPDLSFLSILGWDPHYFRIVSTFLDPNFAGAFFVLTLLLLSRNFAKEKLNFWWFLLVYAALLLTFSRSSYIMFFVSFTILAIFLKSWRLQIITIGLFALLLLGFFIYAQTISLPRNINRTESAAFRINTWTQGWQLFEKHPILGVGFNAYRYAIRDYKLADLQFLKGHGSNSNDSSLLSVAATTGLLGLFAFGYFLFSLIKTNYPQNRKLIFPALAGLLFHSLFANSLFFPPILLWLILTASSDKIHSTS